MYDAIRMNKKIHLKLGQLDNDIYIDKETYGFVLRNLYHNAIKFTQENGHISIETKEIDGNIHTIIEDDGIGIDSIHKITDSKEWFTTKGTFNEVGTGLGLKASIQYLNIKKGTLLIENSKPKGTRVTIIIPKNKN
jgi:signal transduction histidine kinase